MDEREKQQSDKELRRESAIRAQRLTRIFLGIGIGIVVILAIAGGIAYSRYRTAHLPGQFFPEQGREHVAPGYQFTYNSNPPTSGPHFGEPAEWGAYKEELPDQTLIHNLEHGGVWISYKPGIPDDLRQKLENFYTTWGRKIIVTPRTKNDSDIALAAWSRLDTFSASEFSEERVNRFIKAFRNRGPEFVP